MEVLGFANGLLITRDTVMSDTRSKPVREPSDKEEGDPICWSGDSGARHAELYFTERHLGMKEEQCWVEHGQQGSA